LTPVANDGQDTAAGTDTAPGPDSDTGPGRGTVLDLYRSLLDAGRATVRRYRLDIGLEMALIVAYVLLRSLDFGRRPLTGWYVIAGLIALLSPVSGLVLLAAIAPFSESVILTHELGMNPVLLLVVAGSVGIRAAWQFGLTRHVDRPPMAVILAPLLAIGTALGVIESNQAFGGTFGVAQAQMWLAGIGGGLIVLCLAYWVARGRILRPFIVVVGATAIGGIVSLVEFLDSPLIRSGPFAWMVRGPGFPGRLAGLISSPNGTAAAVIIATAVAVAVAILAPDRRARAIGAIGVVPLLLTLYLTYSRAALLGLFVTAVIITWRSWRRAGVALIVLGVVGGAILLPRYLESRYSVTGEGSHPIAGGLLVASDEQRLTAWAAAARMWADSPITGHGFGSYGELGPTYGDPVLNSPHNEWLRLFAEEGLVVGMLGLTFAASVLVALARTRGWMGAATLAAASGYFLAASFNNPFLFLQVGVPAYVTIGTGLAWSRRRSGVTVPPG
jgi:hypothetical protein